MMSRDRRYGLAVHDDVGRDAGAQLGEIHGALGQAFAPACWGCGNLVEFAVQQQEDVLGALDDASFGPPAAQLNERELGLQHGPHCGVLNLLTRLVEHRARAEPGRQQALRGLVAGHRLHQFGNQLFPAHGQDRGAGRGSMVIVLAP